jgi:hypothetical protein
MHFLNRVNRKNRFKKQHFLNRFNKLTDLKSVPKGVKQKKKLQGGILKKFFVGDKAKFACFAEDKYLFTLLYIKFAKFRKLI